MPTDRYSKFVLTVIACCLLWLCVSTAGRPLGAQSRSIRLAQTPAQPVVIVGWGTIDSTGQVTLNMKQGTASATTDPNLPVNVVGYPAPLDVRLGYSPANPLPVGVSSIKRFGDWDPIRTSAEDAPVRSRPGRGE
jgi:hypothetical protein